ncbi:MAG: PLxRFG domain-containing protein [Caldimonas sp.]
MGTPFDPNVRPITSFDGNTSFDPGIQPIGRLGASDEPPITAADDSALQAFGRSATHAALPTVAGVGGSAAGAEIGAGIGAFGGPLDPLTVPAGAIIGGAIGGVVASGATEAAQDIALEAMPDIAQAIGQDQESLVASTNAHPLASFLGSMVPQAALLHPDLGVATDLLKIGTKESGEALAKVAGGAAIQGGINAVQQYADTGEVDPTQLAVAAGTGALLHSEGPLGRLVGGAGRRFAGARPEATSDIAAAVQSDTQPRDLLSLPSPDQFNPAIQVTGAGEAGTPGVEPRARQNQLLNPGEQQEMFLPSETAGAPPQRQPGVLPIDAGVSPVADLPRPPSATPQQTDLFDNRSALLVASDFSHGKILQTLRETNPKADGSPGPADGFTLRLANQVANAIQSGDVSTAHAFIAAAREDLEAGDLSTKTTVARTAMLDAARSQLDQFSSARTNAYANDGLSRALASGQQPAAITLPPVDEAASIAAIREQNRAPGATMADANERAQASITKGAVAARQQILQGVLDDPTTRNPTGRVVAALRKAGYSDTGIHPEEAATISKFVDARDAFTGNDIKEPISTEPPGIVLLKPEDIANPDHPMPYGASEDWIADRDRAIGAQDEQATPRPEGADDQLPAGAAERTAEPVDTDEAGVHAPAASADSGAEHQDAEAGSGKPVRVTYDHVSDKLATLYRNDLIDQRTLNQLNQLVQQQHLSPVEISELANEAAKVHEEAGKALGRAFSATEEPSKSGSGAGFDRDTFDRWVATQPTEDVAKIERELGSRLRALGVKAQLRLLPEVAFGKDTHGASFGNYNGSGALIALALGHDNAVNADSLRHEAMHYLRQHGAFTDAEWSTLSKAADANPDVAKWWDENKSGYGHLPADRQAEERVAELFARWTGGQVKRAFAPGVRGLLQRMGAILNQIRQVFTKHGVTAERIMGDVEKGVQGNRDLEDRLQNTGWTRHTIADQMAQEGEEPSFRKAAGEEQDPLKVTPSDIVTAVSHKGEDALLNFLTQSQIADMRSLQPQLKAQMSRWVDNLRTAVAKKDTYVHEASSAWNDWRTLPAAEQTELGKLLQEGTTRQIDVTNKKAGALNDRFNALSQPAKDVHKAVHDTFKQQAAHAQRVLTQIINATPDEVMPKAEKDQAIAAMKAQFEKLPIYFPLRRFGDYINVAEKQSYLDARDQVEKLGDHMTALAKSGASPAELAVAKAKHDEAQIKLQAEADSGNRQVTSHEDEARQIAEARELEKQGYIVRQKKAQEFDARTDAINASFMAAAMKSLDHEAATSPDHAQAIEGMKSMLNQLYYAMIPESAALRGNLARANVAGFDADAQRAYAATATKNAGFLAQLEHGTMSRQILAEMKKVVDAEPNNKRSTAVYNQVKKHYNVLQQYAETPIQTFLANTAYAYNLGATPAFTFMHLMQTPLTTLPMLSAHFNPMRVSGELLKAFGETSGRLGSLKGDEQAFGRSAGEKQMLAYLMSHSVISGTHADQFLSASSRQTPTGKVGDTVMRVASFMPHYTEKLNRIGTALAAYRMAIETPRNVEKVGLGLSEQQYRQILADNPEYAGMSRAQLQAARYAEKITLDSHIEYSRENAPYVMQQGVVPFGKLIFQFQKYQQGMIHALVRNAVDAFDKNLSGDERMAAAKTLLGIVGTHGLMTGAMGLPGYGLMAFAANAYHKLLGDKDRPFNADDSFRATLDRSLGKDAGDVVARGLFYLPGVRSVLPGDVTDRLGMGDVLTPTTEAGDINREDLLQYLGQALTGPAGALVGNVFDAYNHAHQGDTWKAAEDLMPKVMRDVSRTYRFYTQGVTTGSNNPVVPAASLSPMDLMAQLIGFEPQKVQGAYANRAAVMDAKTELDNRRKVLLKEFADASMAGDESRMQDLRTAVQRYNAAQMQKGLFTELIKGQELSRAVIDRRLAAVRLREGVSLTPKQRALIEDFGDRPPDAGP